MAYEFVYESESKRYRSDCSNVLKETCELLKEKGISAQFSLVGSGARNMISLPGGAAVAGFAEAGTEWPRSARGCV